MIKNNKSIQSYIDQSCERCGSKKRVSRTWKEKIPTFSSTVEVEYSQIICTNPICQAAFDKNLIVEKQKRDAIKLKKDENDLLRKKILSSKREKYLKKG